MNLKFNKNVKSKGKMKISRNTVLAGILTTTLLLSSCNMDLVDTKYGLDKALILGDNSSIVLDVQKWKDYDGEQIQLTTSDNFVLLTSSFDTNCFYGDSDIYSVEEVATSAIESDEVYKLTEDSDGNAIYNKEILDTNWSFNKSITFNGNNALILPVGNWKDYDGEQIQVVTKDGLKLILSTYNSKLVCDNYSDITALDFAQSYIGSDGKVIDLANSSYSGFNYDLIDTNYNFNKAIIIKDETCTILPITEWKDYEGEQLQIEVKGGPTLVTAAYDTILINDIDSEKKAIDIANALGSKVIDLAEGYNEPSIFNKTIIDLNYGFSNAILSNDNSSSALKIDKWTDYEGEQLQVKLDTGDVILSSSFMLDLVNGGTSSINASELSKMYISESGKNIDNSKGNKTSNTHNKYLLDYEQTFKYALKVVDGNVTIIPLKKWQDYYNEDEEDTNCEQIQLILPDDTAIVTTMYDTLLVDNKTDIKELAELVRGEKGVISDLTEYVGEPTASRWNISLFDTKYNFDYAILNNEQTSQLFAISSWKDYKDGEQLQIKFSDGAAILTSFVNTTLIDSKTDGIEEIIAKAFSGDLENTKDLVKKYK